MKKTEQIEIAKQKLKDMLPPGTTVYTVLRHVSQSGMFRIIDMQIKTETGISRIPPYLLDDVGFYYKQDKREAGYRVSGCGMDMGFAIVYDLARILYNEGWVCIGEKCRAN